VKKTDALDSAVGDQRPDDIFHDVNSLSRLEGPVVRGKSRKLVEVMSTV
jgi:hypothetical protein